jgi:hypothetical protein
MDSTNSRLSYPDQLHVWLIGLRLGVFGRIGADEYDLLIDRGLAVVELSRHLDHGVILTEASLRTIVEVFRHAKAPYSSTKPPAKYKFQRATGAPKSHPSAAPMTRRELSELGPHIRGQFADAV